MSVELTEIVMDFPRTRALDGVSCDIRLDEVHGLIGENGAGKSTLVSILAGAQTPTHGALALDDQPLELKSSADALSQGIALVSQEGSLVPSLSGAQNILLGDEPQNMGFLRAPALKQRASDLLAEWFPEVDIDLNVPVQMLDMADQKVIEIVRALRRDVRLVILDEPTATLQAREKEQLWKIIRRLPERGVGVVLISHFLSEVKELSDRITVLRDGKKVATDLASNLDVSDMVNLMLERGMAGNGSGRAKVPTDAAPVLTVSDWRAGNVQVDTFSLQPGEVVGLIGLTGAGHFGFARSLYASLGYLSGQMDLAGTQVTNPSPRQMQNLGFAFVPDHRMENALTADGTIRENLSVVHPEAGKALGFLSPAKEETEARRIMGELNVKASGSAQTVKTLSGGNKQKISLGKWLYGAEDRYKVMIFIELTEGVDVGAKQEIYGHIRRLAESGVAIIVASSDLLEIEQIAHRVVPFAGGRPGPDIQSNDYSEARFIAAMTGERT
ncbi:MAG: sugar ABC transporter ATP-binding protein [Paracoccaceae bacterium]